MSVADLLASELRRDGARPFLTWYDDKTGERVELSVATLANWAAKTANLLSDEHGLAPGDVVRLAPPDHWLAVVAALGAWTMGSCVSVSAAAPDALDLPGDVAAFMSAVLPQPDALLTSPPPATSPALRSDARTWTSAELADAARHAVHEHAVPPGARILSTLSLDTVDGLDATLLVPLACGGSVVWCLNADQARLAERARMERVTHVVGASIPGITQLA